MSSTNNNLSKRENRKKTAVRIIALVLALLMVAGMAYYVVFTLALSASAETTQESYEVIDTSSLKSGGDVLVSVGIWYGDDVVPEFEITSDTGFSVGKQEMSGEKSFTEIWNLDENVVSATSDANLMKYGNDYLLTNDYYSCLIGGYHIQIDCDDMEREQFEEYLAYAGYMVSGYGMYAIPSYIYTGYAVRLGDFATWDDAYAVYDYMVSLFSDRYVSIVSPSNTAVSVIDPTIAKILFEFDCGSEYSIGFCAHTDMNGNTYMKTPSGTVYDGVFAFKRYISGSVDGVSLINILPIEAYIAGVLPYEISNSWPIEVQKEFAIAARSFTLSHLNSKHRDYGFDLCNSTCCEVYKGAGRINKSVMDAVLGTRGIVMSYNGDIVTSYYSSTVGGVTVSAADAWGGTDIPYLQAMETPWEDYMSHSNGFWMCEVSPTELLERLHKAGYNELRGQISDLQIVELAKNSTYVKALRVTDIYGTSITINYTDKVRTSLTPYVNSANFVVGRGQVEYTETAVISSSPQSSTETPYSYETPDAKGQLGKDGGFTETAGLYVLTSSSYDRLDYIGYVNIMTADGEVECTRKNIFTATNQTAEAYLGDEFEKIADQVEAAASAKPEDKYSTETIESKSSETVKYKIAHAKDPNNFIFVGKGWGHGVGMSQWGAYDLAVKGYSYDRIIHAYFPSVDLIDYRLTNKFRYDY